MHVFIVTWRYACVLIPFFISLLVAKQLLGYMQNILQTYAAAPQNMRDYRRKDGALVALGYVLVHCYTWITIYGEYVAVSDSPTVCM